MNTNLWRRTITPLLFIVAAFAGHAQNDLSDYEIGLTGGVFVYQGDLTPSQFGSYRTLRPVVNLFVNRKLSNAFSLRGSLFYGGLRGNDAVYNKPEWRQQRNLNFSSSALELSGMGIWFPLSNEHAFSPYVFGGLGVTFLNIKRDWSRFNGEFFSTEDLLSKLTEDINHPTPKLIPVMPLGVGAQYNISRKWFVVAESSYRLTKTDYLDGFSKAGNPDLSDHYQSHTVGLLYRIGRKSALNCPTIF